MATVKAEEVRPGDKITTESEVQSVLLGGDVRLSFTDGSQRVLSYGEDVENVTQPPPPEPTE